MERPDPQLGGGDVTTGNRLPSYGREIDELKREIRKLWQALGAQQGPPPSPESMPFSWSGTVSGTKTSGPWWVPADVTITAVTLGARVASSTSITVSVHVDGVSAYTTTLGAGQTRAMVMCSIPVGYTSRVQLVVSGGSGAQDFTAGLGYVRSVAA
jgi:hypothetical protein